MLLFTFHAVESLCRFESHKSGLFVIKYMLILELHIYTAKNNERFTDLENCFYF